MLVNASVYDRCCSRSILPWTIFDVGDDSLSLSDFYQRVIIRDCVQAELQDELMECWDLPPARMPVEWIRGRETGNQFGVALGATGTYYPFTRPYASIMWYIYIYIFLAMEPQPTTSEQSTLKKEKCLSGILTRVHHRFQDLRFYQCSHLVSCPKS